MVFAIEEYLVKNVIPVFNMILCNRVFNYCGFTLHSILQK
jgi:hypothetical protein